MVYKKNDSGNRRKYITALKENAQTGVTLYLAAFALFLLADSLSTTMFGMPSKFLFGLKAFALLLIFAKVVFFDRFSVREFWLFVFMLVIGLFVYRSSGYTEPFLWLIMLFGAKDVPLRKILQVYLFISVAVVLLAFCASMIGVIENLQYNRESDVSDSIWTARRRNSFGTIYPTDFASHIFSIMLAAVYLLKGRMRVWYYVPAICVTVLVGYFCNARLDTICMALLILCSAFLTLMINGKLKKIHFVLFRKNRRWTICLMPAAAVLMLVLTYLYSTGNKIIRQVDLLMSGRLNYGQQGLTEYGITLFGQQIEMEGNGGTLYHVKEYFFIDCSYLYVLLCYGLIFFLIVMAVYILCARRFQKDAWFLMVLGLITLNCMIAHHLVSLAYNPFFLALFAGAEEGFVCGNVRFGMSLYRWNGRYAGANHWNEVSRDS